MNRLGKSASTSAALCVLFLLVYGGCNRMTAWRANVPSFYLEWERQIPFIPAMIVPYMSIDLFFIAAPFVVTSDRQRRTLAARIVFAILVAGFVFLLFPLKFAFDRPHVEGFLGLIFNNFRTLDLPFNQFPSLHIALLAILADAYGRNLKGAWRRAVGGWFVLIALSPLLTWQHHVIDVAGGFALGILCLHVFREHPVSQPFRPNHRVGTYYAIGAASIALLALALRPWGSLLLWPAFSLAFAAAGYLWLGPAIYAKENGRHAWTTPWVLGPVVLGQWLSSLHYARRCRAYDRVNERLWIGRRLSRSEARKAREAGVSAVVDLTTELSEAPAFLGVPYLHIPVLDLTAPTQGQIEQAVEFLKRHAGQGISYVHCKAGYSRTAVIAGAYLLSSGAAGSVDEALAELRRVRPSMVVRPEALAALRAFQHQVEPVTLPAI